jgi:hypothetical protein
MQTKLKRGEPVDLLGIGPAGHNAGGVLVEVSCEQGIRLLCNNEGRPRHGKSLMKLNAKLEENLKIFSQL